MLITQRDWATQSLADLFQAIHDRFDGRLIAIGRPQPSVPGVQYAHVKLAYHSRTGAHPDGTFPDGQPVCVVHTASLNSDLGRLVLGNGHYDLTEVEAWKQVS